MPTLIAVILGLSWVTYLIAVLIPKNKKPDPSPNFASGTHPLEFDITGLKGRLGESQLIIYNELAPEVLVRFKQSNPALFQGKVEVKLVCVPISEPESLKTRTPREALLEVSDNWERVGNNWQTVKNGLVYQISDFNLANRVELCQPLSLECIGTDLKL